MPNHVTNQVVIYIEDKDELKRILTEIKGEHEVIDFATIIPTPDHPAYNTDGLTAEARQAEPEFNWYDWNVKNWGTKWNAYSQSIEGPEDDQVTLTFDTAWAPPLPVIAALKEKYPGAHIGGSWLEEGHQSAGVF